MTHIALLGIYSAKEPQSMILIQYSCIWFLHYLKCRYHDEPRPEFTGPMEVNNHLRQGQRLLENEIIGPEGLTLDSEGSY